MANFDILKPIDLGLSFDKGFTSLRTGVFFIATKIATMTPIDMDPELPNNAWPVSQGLTPGVQIPKLAAFIAEGSHTEPIIGQIWPR